ncbi:HNH endonuclease [Bdellovibrio sp. HCB-162]|uniref:HNH endonuclease n=1 Tax=Bdellovibrio sp. HCB-162 TaxID=3394234 RepID=UPI0039BC37DF
MELKNISNNELVQRLEKLVRTERKITHLVLLHIAEIEDRKIYAERGYDGMYSYLTRGLGYSEGSAYRRLHSARLLKQVPAVAEKIENGSLNLTQLTQVQKHLKEDLRAGNKPSPERTEKILEGLQYKNTFETQKTLAVEFNQPIQKSETLRPQADDSVRIEITLTAEQFQELEQAKSLLSHICPDGSWAEVISTLAKGFNQKKLVGKSKLGSTSNSVRASDQTRTSTQVVNAAMVLQPRRKYLSIQKKRKLFNQANHCCEYTDSQTLKRCGSKFQLEVDHVHPVALGGSDDIGNLRILCRTHNVLAARQWGLN